MAAPSKAQLDLLEQLLLSSAFSQGEAELAMKSARAKWANKDYVRRLIDKSMETIAQHDQNKRDSLARKRLWREEYKEKQR